MQIKETKVKWSRPIDVYRYDIDSGPDAPKGDVEIIYYVLEEMLWEIRRDLKKFGLVDGDKIMQINRFYPNGQGLNDERGEFMRRGVGTEVYRYLVDIALHNDTKAMFVCSLRKSMQAFLNKHGFTRFNDVYFVKLMNESA